MKYRVEFLCEFSGKWTTYAICQSLKKAEMRANMFEVTYGIGTRIRKV